MNLVLQTIALCYDHLILLSRPRSGSLVPVPVVNPVYQGMSVLLAAVLVLSVSVTGFSIPAQAASGQKVALHDGLARPYPAPAIDGIQQWVNSKPLTLSKLKGKVVLVDFWTYSCINCIRTLPHMSALYDKYKDKGLVVVGVHSPEFEFEKVGPNVQKAVETYNIKYPVALDSRFITWNNYNNSFWPAHYLIDQNGNVVYEHFGEGNYQAMETNVRQLLGLTPEKETKTDKEPRYVAGQTPETYLGFVRTKSFSSPEGINPNRTTEYSLPQRALRKHHWALEGKWRFLNEKLVAESAGAKLQMTFVAKKVFLVLGPTSNGKPMTVKIRVQNAAGQSVPDRTLTVDRHTLYTLTDLKDAKGGTLSLESDVPGLEAYAFTFGSD